MTRFFLYCENANTADADALLARQSISATSYGSIQAGVTEYSFETADDVAAKIESEIFNGRVPVQFSKTKLPITGSIGTVSYTPTAPSAVLAGTVAVTTSAAAIAASTTSTRVTLRSDVNNTQDILLGNSASQPYVMSPGDAIDVDVDNLNKIYVRTGTGTATLYYFGS
jgi:hypothetical protein